MKLKYYLRGLGIGMLAAALVLILSGNTGGEMSDEAVKKRAAALGMVEKDKSVLGDMDKEGAAPEESAAGEQPEAEEAQPDGENPAGIEEDAGETEAAADGEQEPGGDAGEEEAGEAGADDDDAGQAQAEEIEQRADEVADRAEEIAANEPIGQVVSFTVVQGESSIVVARKAEEAGLVGSAAEFDRFLIDNGYDKRISIGTYEIRVGESAKEIADKITKTG